MSAPSGMHPEHDHPEHDHPEQPGPPGARQQRPVRRSGRLGRTAAAARLGSTLGAGTVAKNVARRLAPPERRDEVARAYELRTAEQVARSLGQMKGALMKLGQLASFIDEGLPEPFRKALATLQADAPPMAAELVSEVVTAELGVAPDEAFADFDPVPLAAASIGQVHRATTHDGRAVAVKVQYPGVDDAIRADLANTAMLARMLPALFPSLDGRVLATELRDRLIEELDYRREGANQHRFAEAYRDHPFIHVPDVVRERSTARVLTTELAEGARFDEVVTWSQDERDLAGETLFRFVFRGINRLGIFNGDPHPGNYLFRPGGRITFLDFGLVRAFSPEETHVFNQMIQTLVLDGDGDGYRRVLEDVGLLRGGAGLTTDQVVEYFGHFYALVREPGPFTVGSDYASETVRRIFDRTSPVAAAVDLPPMFVIVQRINLGLYALLARLEATADWRRIAEELWPMTDGPPSTELGRLEAAWARQRVAGAP